MADNPVTDVVSHLPGKGAKIGKHSVWLWGAVIALAVLLYVWYSRSGNNGTADETTDTTADNSGLPDASGGALTPSSGGVAGDSTPPATTPVPPDDSSSDDSSSDDSSDLSDLADQPSNFDYEQKAVAYLVSKGVPGEYAQAVVEAYLNGDKTSYNGQLLMNAVIAHQGIAPEGIGGPISIIAKPSPKPPKRHPVKHHAVKKPPKKKPKKPKKHRPAKHHTTHHTTHHAAAHHPAKKPAKHKPAKKATIKKRRK